MGFARAAVGILLVCAAGCFEGELQVDEPKPFADAGFDQVRFLGQTPVITVELDGRASCDPLGQDAPLLAWAVVDAPPYASPVVTTSGTFRAVFVAESAGDYLVSLRALVDGRESDTDFVAVRVHDGDGSDLVVAPPDTNACGEPLPES
jgi:hypothetical protein